MTDAEVLDAVARAWDRRSRANATPGRRFIALGVTANDVAPGRARGVAPKLAKLARDGRLTRQYDDRAGDAGAFVYRPA
jgi:hypothetical protein